MKIRITKNNPIDDLASDITNLIGQVYESELDNEKHAHIIYNGIDFMIYYGEYEIIKEENN